MTICFFDYLEGVGGYVDTLKDDVKKALGKNSADISNFCESVSDKVVALVHRSHMDDDPDLKKKMKQAALLILLHEPYGQRCEKESEKEKQHGIEATWICGTELIRDYFPRLKKYIEDNETALVGLDPSGWVPILDRFNALKILAQGYLVTHDCDKLLGYEGISISNRIKLKSHAKETEDPQWWLSPLLAGTNKKAICSGVVDNLVDKFKKQLGAESDEFKMVKQFLTCDINDVEAQDDFSRKLLDIEQQATKT